MSIKFEYVSFELGKVLPYGWAPFPGKWNGTIMGHEFTMVGMFKIKSHFQLKKGKQIITTLPALQWKEKEFWYEGNAGGTVWTYKGETDKGDLYQSAPNSPTWGGFAQGKTDPRSHGWLAEPGSDVDSSLFTKLLSLEQYDMVHGAKSDILRLKGTKGHKDAVAMENTKGKYNESKDKQFWMQAEKMIGRKLPCIALDRPGMALSGGSGASGGGFKSLTTAASRRRILQFDLGMVGCATRFSATQVLETIDGEPSISKFIIPGKNDNWCKNLPPRHLAYWRSRLNSANVEDQSNDFESDSVIAQWEQWAQRLGARGLG